jgi:5-methyltetrahydropteroyltriglutamate--homocysteine methyltransferase
VAFVKRALSSAETAGLTGATAPSNAIFVMIQQEAPMLKTTLAGSLPKPLWLAEPEKLWAPWKLEGAALEEGKRDATVLAIKLQEDAGLDIVGDGEQARVHFVHGFLANLAGIDFNKKTLMGIRNNRYKAEVPTVVSAILRKGPVHSLEASAARAHTARKLKFTLPGPMTIVDTIADEHYGRRADLAMAFAAVLNEEAKELEALGVDIIQFDEPAFNVYMKEVGDWGIATLERAAQGLKCTTAVHICYGYGIKANIDWKATLGESWRHYEDTFPLLRNSTIQQVSLECRNSKVPLDLIKLLKGKDVMVGAIDVASDMIETPEEVAATIRAAMAYVEPEKMFPCTNCGMAPMSSAVAYGKLAALAKGAELVRKELAR